MVCTETYLQRFNRGAPPGVGRGVLWEAKAIRALLYGVGAASRKLVPVLFGNGGRDHVPLPLQGGYISRIETEEGYERLYRLLTGQPDVRKPELGTLRRLPERQAPVTVTSVTAAPIVASEPHPRVGDIFVGRQEEREQLAAALFPASGRRRPVVVSGMPGVGKSYLVDRFYWQNMTRFPGGYVRLALNPANPGSAADLLNTLPDRLKLPAGDGQALAHRLLMPLTLLHIENADSFDAGRVVGELAGELPGCAVVVSARFRRLGTDTGWPEVPLAPFDERVALEQLRAELGENAPRQESWPALVADLGFLPLALHPRVTCERTIARTHFCAV
jgi:AAA ATPase domain